MTSTEIKEGDPAAFAFWLRFWSRVVALLEIVGGLAGLYMTAFGTLIGTNRVIFLAAFVLFVASVWGGVLLALGRRGGVAVSLVVQAVQLVQVAAGGLIYAFVSGLQLVVGLRQTDDGPDVGFNLAGPARFLVFLNPPGGGMTQGLFTGLNVAALLSIVCLLFLRSSARGATPPAGATSAIPEAEGAWPPAPEL